MVCYIILALVMIFCGLAGFYRFIGDYEKNLPSHVMENIVEAAKEDGGAALFNENLQLKLTPFEKPELIAKTLFSGGGEPSEISFKRSSREYKDSAPVYILQWGKRDLAKIFLSEQEKSEYGFTVWQVSSAEPLLSITPEKSIEAILPEDASLYINGTLAGEEYKTEEISLKGLDEAAKYVSLPKLSAYKADGLYLEPEVTALSKDGVALASEKKDGCYTFSYPASEELEGSAYDLVISAENAYISYMIDENKAKQENFSRLSQYLVSGSQIDISLRKVDVEWNIQYDSRVNDYIKAENFIPYGDDCFTCELLFKVTLKKYSHESDFSGHLRWTFVRTANGWKAAQMELI